MQDKEKEDLEGYDKYKLSQKKHKILKEVESYDEYGNKIVTLQEVEEEGPYKAPTSKKLTKKVIKDADGIEKTVFVDDAGNIVDTKDVEFVKET